MLSGLESLCALVNANKHEDKMSEIKMIVDQRKLQKGLAWYRTDKYLVENAVRDAILSDQIEVLRFFLGQGVYADLYANDQDGGIKPLIDFAARIGNLPMVKLLVEKRARIKPDPINYYKNSDEAIRIAVIENHTDVVEYLLENGATANGEITHRGITFLGKAALNGNSQMVRALICNGANVRAAVISNHQNFTQNLHYYNEELSQRLSDKNRNDIVQYGLLADVAIFDKKKQKLIQERDQLKITYERSAVILFDHAIGVDFDGKPGFLKTSDLIFLRQISKEVKFRLNFIGVSLDGNPLTEETLGKSEEVNSANSQNVRQGTFWQSLASFFTGVSSTSAHKHLFTMNDLATLQDVQRQNFLQQSLENLFEEQGRLINQDGYVIAAPLEKLAELGDIKAVRARLAGKKVDPNQFKKTPPIVCAARKGNLDIVKLLAETPDIDKQSFLLARNAARSGYPSITTYLTSLLDINGKYERGNTQLHEATKEGDIEKIKFLLSKGADVNIENDERRDTPLSIAVAKFHSYDRDSPELAEKYAIIMRIFLESKTCSQRTINMAFEIATSKEISSEAVKLLLPYIEKKDFLYITKDEKERYSPWYVDPMFRSFYSRADVWMPILLLLLEHGANLSAKDVDGQDTLLCKLIRSFPSIDSCEGEVRVAWQNEIKYFKENLEILDFLLQHGADPTIAEEKHGQTPLHVFLDKIDVSFIEQGCEQIIDRFLQRGADINIPDKYGNTPLHIAASKGRLTAVAYLISRGANVEAQNLKNKTPLVLATEGNFLKTAALLMPAANMNRVKLSNKNTLSSSQSKPIASFVQPCWKQNSNEESLEGSDIKVTNELSEKSEVVLQNKP